MNSSKKLWKAIISNMPRKTLQENSDEIYIETHHKYRLLESIDFDAYCNTFCKTKGVPNCKSTDTFCYSSFGKCLYFIEFKNIEGSYKNYNANSQTPENYLREYYKREKYSILLKGACGILLLFSKFKQTNLLRKILDMDKKYFVFCKFPTNNLSKLQHNLARLTGKVEPYSFLFINHTYMSIDNFDNFLEEDKIQFTEEILFENYITTNNLIISRFKNFLMKIFFSKV